VDLVQFVDGDCAVEPGWIEAAADAMAADPSLGLVTGWRTEVDPARNVFHAMAEHEWRQPAGEIALCGGDMMVRADAFRRVGGFDPGLIAGEDGEFCLRLRAETGLRLLRLPRVMTRHDVDMDRAGEWWRRHVRSGHAYAEVAAMRPPAFRREVLRAWAYGLGLPLLGVLGLILGAWWLVALVALLFALSGLSAWRGLRRGGMAGREARRQAGWLVLSKLPNLQGILTYHLRRLRGARRELIEYK
jgi:GT2 family glycosyltransferase